MPQSRKRFHFAAFVLYGLMPLCSSYASSLWVVGSTQPSEQFVSTCRASLGQTRVIVHSPKSEPNFHYHLGVRQLTDRAQNQPDSHRVLGLTEAQHLYQANIHGKTLQDKTSGLACTRPTVNVTITSGIQQVFIAREFPQGTCSHMAIVEHELRHVMVNQLMAEYVAKQLQNELNAYLGQIIFIGSTLDIGTEITSRLERDWFPWAKAMMREAEKMHLNIDTPEENERMRQVCAGEINLRLSKTRHEF